MHGLRIKEKYININKSPSRYNTIRLREKTSLSPTGEQNIRDNSFSERMIFCHKVIISRIMYFGSISSAVTRIYTGFKSHYMLYICTNVYKYFNAKNIYNSYGKINIYNYLYYRSHLHFITFIRMYDIETSKRL